MRLVSLACGGIAREFYKLIGQSNFRPSEAEAAFEKLLAGTGVVVHKLAHLDNVTKGGANIVSITMEDGLEVRAKQFIDTPYEGDLLARLFESGADPKIHWSLDTNNHHLFNGAYFIDFVGANYGWPDADWDERERIFMLLCQFDFDNTAVIEISNQDTDGYVFADAVQLLPPGEKAK